VDACKEVLQGYHYALHRQSRQLAKEKWNKEKEGISKCNK
jgi:hypothetical protein